MLYSMLWTVTVLMFAETASYKMKYIVDFLKTKEHTEIVDVFVA